MDYKTYAYNAAKSRGIDPDLFLRLVQQESGWNPNAVSPKGAAGLTQAMPDTARDPGFGVAPLTNPNDPYAQIDFGADYLGAMLKRYGGDTTKALAAYNWGAGNADKWNGDLNALPEETRNYVNVVGGGGGNLTVSSSGGPALQGLGTPEMIKATTLGGGPLPDYMIQNAANRALNTVDYSTSPAFGPVIPNFANGGNFGDPALAGISSGGGVPVDPALAAPEEEKEYEWLKKLFPNTDKEGRNERLLAIGAGLLSGNNWQEGLAAAGQGLLGVVQDDKNKQFEIAQTQLQNQMANDRAARSNVSNTLIQLKGRDPKTGMEVVRAGTMINGIPHVFGDDGQPIAASSIMTEIAMAGRNEAQDVTAGAGGIPNAVSISSDGTPSFQFKREDEAKTYTFATRAIAATRDIDAIISQVGVDEITSLQGNLEQWAAQNARESITPAIINSAIDSAGIQGAARSAMSQYLQAVLRADTGAAYSGTEIADYAGAFLPNAGDDAMTVEYKKFVREREIESLIGRTGAAAPYLYGVMDGTYELTGKGWADLQPQGEGALDSSNADVPEGVDPETWNYLTPEQKALWK